MGIFDSTKLPGNPFKKQQGAKITAEQRLEQKAKEETLARVGLTPEDERGAVVDKRPPPAKDTRKKLKVRVNPTDNNGGEIAQASPTKKKRKKKKLKLDPKAEYARLKEEEEAALRALNGEENNEEEEEDKDHEDKKWHDCIRCMEQAEHRPLIGDNGEYLCHACYWALHPEVARREQQGDDFHEKEVPEGEECRSCLDQGYLRRCCNEFYCHKCYLRTGFCPGCNQRVNTRGLGKEKEDPGIYAVLATWTISAFYLLFIFGMALSIILNEYHLPETIWGYKCYGYFPSCDMEICVDLDATPEQGIQSAATYKFCNLGTTVNKIRGKVCVYDEELFKQSENTLGYDFCYDVKGRVGTDKSDEFLNGVYVFEDNFDFWRNKTDYSQESIFQASANWEEMTNAQVTDFCGINVQPGDQGYPAIGAGEKFGEGALVFSGVLKRNAVTKPLDMSNGGTVNFFLKFAPIVEDEDATRCKTAFGGDVHLKYCVTGPANCMQNVDDWVKFGSYLVYEYRYEHFSPVSAEVPEAAWSNETMFMWDQPYFENRRDYWALDDISIFHRFDGTWRESEAFVNKKEESDMAIQVAQCCMETEHCENDPDSFLPDNKADECGGVKGWKEGYYMLRGADAYIAITALLALCKFLYNFAILMLTQGDVVVDKFVKKYLPRSCKPKKRAVMFDFQQKSDEPPPGMLAEGAFECQVHPKFRRAVVLTFLGPYVIALLWMFSVTGTYTVYQPFVAFNNEASLEQSTYQDRPPYVVPNSEMETSSGFLVFLCMSMDASNIYWLAKHVFCLWPAWVPEVSIDTNPRNNWLRVGKQKIILTDIQEIHRFSKKFCWYVTALYILGGMPWCSAVMICKSFWMTYEKARLVVGCVGFMTCFRAFFGANVFVKFHFAMEFVLTTNNDIRDDMGLSMRDQKIKYLGGYSALVVCCSVGLIIGTYYYHSKLHTFVVAMICGFFGGVYGVVLGLLQGLPTSPQFLLTRWPDEGHTVIYEKKTHCPCIFYCAYCSDMHTRVGYLVLFLDNMQGYQALLKGEQDIGDDFDPMAG
mmetsp:Transcript_18357/g.38203  ORF Transcript_18357/g.38203 Transcript_18357/m.38203 type:complete len:1044 (+) Transcript_18357:115-3246(+)